MNSELLCTTIGAHFAGRVEALLGDYVHITECDYDAAADVCRLLTSAASKTMGLTMQTLETKIRARTRVTTVSIYACEKGRFRIELHGCMEEYTRWSKLQLRISSTERLLYFVFGLFFSLACFVFYLFYR